MPSDPVAPFGRRSCPVVDSRPEGGYRLLSLRDERGPAPAPGQFYMLAAAPDAAPGWTGEDGRPFLPRALSYARVDSSRRGHRLDFLIDEVGPGTRRLAGLTVNDHCLIAGPFGHGFSLPRKLNPQAAGAILVGGGIGIAPIAVLRRALIDRGIPYRALLGFRDRAHSGGIEELFGCEQTLLAFEDGSSGHRGYVTDLLLRMLEGDDPGGAVVYACGPPAMLEAVRVLCGERGVPVELALESPVACGFGACYGCAVPKAGGDGYFRLCVDGPVLRGDEIATALAGVGI